MKPGPGMPRSTSSGPFTLTLSNVTDVPGIHLASCVEMPARLPPVIVAVCTLGKFAPEK